MNMDPMKREREVDEWLEAGLRQYGKAEPRVGLENRVLASLQVERNRMAAPSRWWWLVTATALAAMVVAVWVWQSGRVARPGNAGIATAQREERRPIEPPQVPQIARPDGTTAAKQVAARRPGKRPSRDVTVAATPKLEQFPSPRPLSEQEQILMSYVARYRESAVLVAQAQAEALERDREEEAAAAANGNME